jgi:hypothetical protein
MPRLHPSKARTSERGNAFFIILLGVVLFAAVSFTVARGMRSESTSNLTKRQSELAASDIIGYGQRLERAVAYLRRRGASESDISFVNDEVSGYAHSPAQNDNRKVFHLSGGGVSWKSPPQNSNDGSDWHFTGNTCIVDVGNGSTGCNSDSEANEDLIAVLPNISSTLCEMINKRLGVSSIPTDSGGGHSSTKFTGTFADGTIINLETAYSAICYQRAGSYHYYTVLLER